MTRLTLWAVLALHALYHVVGEPLGLPHGLEHHLEAMATSLAPYVQARPALPWGRA